MDEETDLSRPKQLPMSWVDRIFEIMETIYGEKWTNWQGDPKKISLYKTLWASGLIGLSSDEIKRALTICRYMKDSLPPTPIEFYHYGIGQKKPPYVKQNDFDRGNHQVARNYLNDIKQKLGKCSTQNNGQK